MLKKYPDDAHAMNNMAYHLATSADPSIRDNRRAILFATEACRLSEWKNHDFLDTLATVYAEAGQFDKAIEWETKALEIAPDKTDEDKKNRNEFRTRLEHYQKGEK
jgi:tetratricopeptide (TPR) repeat protein